MELGLDTGLLLGEEEIVTLPSCSDRSLSSAHQASHTHQEDAGCLLFAQFSSFFRTGFYSSFAKDGAVCQEAGKRHTVLAAVITSITSGSQVCLSLMFKARCRGACLSQFAVSVKAQMSIRIQPEERGGRLTGKGACVEYEQADDTFFSEVGLPIL